MYEHFLKSLVTLIGGLNQSLTALDDPDKGPYLDHVPVIYDDELVGFLRDEIGDEYSYHTANAEELLWWATRPWKHS